MSDTAGYVKPAIYKTWEGDDLVTITMDPVKVGDKMLITYELLACADPAHIQQDGDILTMYGQTFRIYARDEATHYAKAERI